SGRESRGAEWLQDHLRPGRRPEAYRRMLRDMGYAITVNGDTPDYVEYDISKEDQAYRVKIGVDQDTGRAVEINVVPERGERSEAWYGCGRCPRGAGLANEKQAVFARPVTKGYPSRLRSIPPGALLKLSFQEDLSLPHPRPACFSPAGRPHLLIPCAPQRPG